MSATAHAAPARGRAGGAADDAPVLVLAATAFELAPLRDALLDGSHHDGPWDVTWLGAIGRTPVVLAVTGVGKVNAAAGLTLNATVHRPRAIVQVGIGGAYLGSFLSNGLVAAASEEWQLDLGLRRPDHGVEPLETLGFPATPARDGRPERFNRVPTDARLQTALSEGLGLPLLRFATLDAITADVDLGASLQRDLDVSVESMEGAAAAQVADRLGVPFAEVRGVSNLVGERDKRLWDVRGAITASCRAVRALIERWDDDPATQTMRGSAVPERAW